MLDLNLGQVQAVIDGYSDRVVDQICVAVWSGFYSGYYTNSRHPKKPSELIKQLTQQAAKKSKDKSLTTDVDMAAEIEKFAQRDLEFFAQRGGDSTGNNE